jgi:hypothetical protein
MRSNLRPTLLPALAVILGLALLAAPHPVRVAAQSQSQRPSITGAILLREGDKVTIDRGSQHGLRKGDKLQVLHGINGKLIPAGALLVTRVFGTTAEAKVTEQNGAVGPEDVVIFQDAPASAKPSEPPHRSTAPAARQTPQEQPVTTSKTVREPSTATTTAQPAEPTRKVEMPLPLLPQFSADKAGGASFSFDFTNESEKVLDASIYRLSARLIYDGQDYRTVSTTLAGNYNITPGKTRSFSLSLTDFTLVNDKDVWPLKSGRHTVVIRFGGKQYGPLLFDWRSDNTTNDKSGSQ